MSVKLNLSLIHNTLSTSMRTSPKSVKHLLSWAQILHTSHIRCSTLPTSISKGFHQIRCYNGVARSNFALSSGIKQTSPLLPVAVESTNRIFHSSTNLQSRDISKVIVNPDKGCVDVTIGQRELNIPFVWLRDHCRSDLCYNWDTNQKNVDPGLLQKDLTPQDVVLTPGGSCINITWKDGHKSEFTSVWLLENFYPGCVSRVTQRTLWDKDIIQDQGLPTVCYTDHMNTQNGLKDTLRNLVTYGFCMVSGVPASIEGTQAVVERLTFVLETLFGRMWSFTSDASRSDTAYSTLGLGAHTDATFMDYPAGIQVFQCLKHTGSGGETLLVDGYRSVEELRATSPEDFHILSQTEIPHEYKEPPGEHSPGYHLHSLGKVIRLHPASGEVIHLRFNPYDRAPLNTVPPDQQLRFYSAYDRLASIIGSPRGQLWVKLTPGTVVLIDNWRVMHGRGAFDGQRVMCGCYLPRDEWMSKARMLGVL